MLKLVITFLLIARPVATADTARPDPRPSAKVAPKSVPSSPEQSKALVRRFYEQVWNRGNLDVADEVFAKDYVRHEPGGSPGPEGQKRIAAGIRLAFPDIVMVIDFMIAEGDMVAARWTITATHKGDLPMAKATGKVVKFSGMNIYRFAGGKVVELWNHRDDLSMLMQLGVVPAPNQTSPPTTPAKPPATKTR